MAASEAMQLSPLNIPKWLEENRHLLKPPVGNRVLRHGEMTVMIVAGPNARTDYHVEDGEEVFYMLEGSMTLKVIVDGDFRDVRIHEGDLFCLPPRVPHSPQRDAGSIGIVIERERRPGELDAVEWYCQAEACRNMLYREEFFCDSLDTALGPIIMNYYRDEAKRTCSSCGLVESVPMRMR